MLLIAAREYLHVQMLTVWLTYSANDIVLTHHNLGKHKKVNKQTQISLSCTYSSLLIVLVFWRLCVAMQWSVQHAFQPYWPGDLDEVSERPHIR